MNRLLALITFLIIYPYSIFSQIKLEEFNFNGGTTKEFSRYLKSPTSLSGFSSKFTMGSYININSRIKFGDKISATFGILMPSLGYRGSLTGGWQHTTKHFIYLGISGAMEYKLHSGTSKNIYAGVGLMRIPRVGFDTITAGASSSEHPIISEFELTSRNKRGYILTAQVSLSKKIHKNLYFNSGVQAGLGLRYLFQSRFIYYLNQTEYSNRTGHIHTIVTKGDFIAFYIGIQYHIYKRIIK